MKYFVITPKKDNYCPIGLSEGILHTELNLLEPFTPLKTDSGEWRKYMHMNTELPEKFWFVTRDKRYNFDFRWDSGGFILSEIFINLLNKYNANNFNFSPLNFVNKKGESVSTKTYYYVKFFNPLNIVDYDKSKISFNKQGYIKKVIELHLKTLDIPNIFVLQEGIFFNKLFCSEVIVKEVKFLKLKGIDFIPIENYEIVI